MDKKEAILSNQFKKLRCPEDQMKPTHKIEELEKAGIGKHSTIYKYESGESKPGFDALKAYKHFFNCSYEYLFDEAPLPLEKHKYITDASLLSKFDTASVNNLEQMLTDAEYSNFNTYMFKAFLANPTALQGAMDILFRFMHQLSYIYGDASLRQAEKELKASSLWFSLNQYMDTYFRDILMPNLDVGFKRYEAKNAKREEEAGERAVNQYEEYEKQQEEYDRSITITVGEPIIVNDSKKEEKG